MTMYVVECVNAAGNIIYLRQKHGSADYVLNIHAATRFDSMTEANLRAIELGLTSYEVIPI